jgi:DNA-binding NarL/FixJ family response regulator
MVNPPRSNLSFAKVYSDTQEAGFENIICEYVDVLELIKGIKSVRKKQIIGYKAMGYDNWEIAKKLRIPERTLDRRIAELKRFFIKSGGKSRDDT